jgi:hypothetical protein
LSAAGDRQSIGIHKKSNVMTILAVVGVVSLIRQLLTEEMDTANWRRSAVTMMSPHGSSRRAQDCWHF